MVGFKTSPWLRMGDVADAPLATESGQGRDFPAVSCCIVQSGRHVVLPQLIHEFTITQVKPLQIVIYGHN